MPAQETDPRPLSKEILTNLEPVTGTAMWTESDCMLYALGVGAGSVDPVLELNLTTENSCGVDLQAIPTFGITLSTVGSEIFSSIGIQGDDILLTEESIKIAFAIPTSGSVDVSSWIRDVEDHPRGYTITIVSDVCDTISRDPMFTNQSKTLIRSHRTSGEINRMHRRPEEKVSASGEPDKIIDFPIARNQCLLYRLASGRNPIHSDPSVSRSLGYEVPFLHGRCTLGFAARHIISALCNGDAEKLRSIGGSFSAPVFPGDCLTLRIWGGSTRGSYEVVRSNDQTPVVRKGTYECFE